MTSRRMKEEIARRRRNLEAREYHPDHGGFAVKTAAPPPAHEVVGSALHIMMREDIPPREMDLAAFGPPGDVTVPRDKWATVLMKPPSPSCLYAQYATLHQHDLPATSAPCQGKAVGRLYLPAWDENMDPLTPLCEGHMILVVSRYYNSFRT